MLRHGNRVKTWDGFRKVIASSVLIFLVLIIFYWSGDQTPSSTLENPHNKLKPSSSLGFRNQKWNSFDSLVQFHPTVEFRNGTDLIWQIPESPKAVLFIAHGCNCKAVYFWDRSQTCLHCIGLPEERLIVLEALSRKFAVLTISSAGRCWSMGKERIIARDIIRWWRRRENLEKVPLVALGASSGGYFVSALANDIKFNSVTLMIAEGIFDQMDVMVDYPPTLFVHMPKDTRRQHRIGRFINDLRAKGIDVAGVQCLEFPLSPNIFSDRIPGLEENVSAKLFDLFHEKGFIDENGYMKNDGRATRWKEAVKKDSTILLDKQLFQHVQEELNLAFAYHEMTSLQSDQIFKWFESHMS